MPYKDLRKQKRYQKEHYANNKEAYGQRFKDRKLVLRKFIHDLKLKSVCSRCGENHPACLDFHHKDPSNKSFGISRAVNLGKSLANLKLELVKCEIICSNCHRKEHDAFLKRE